MPLRYDDAMHANEPKRTVLANLPTPVVELNNLAKHLGVPTILMKRDDLTGLETSGNKVHKLEYLVADAIAKVVSQSVASGGTVEAALPALQTELTNLAKINGYTVE